MTVALYNHSTFTSSLFSNHSSFCGSFDAGGPNFEVVSNLVIKSVVFDMGSQELL